MASISLSGISKAFGQITAVDNLDLDVRDGELVVVVGPSGCGKTTVLRMIAGLETPSAGSIQIGGRDVNRVAPRNRNVAMVFQNNALYPHMTVRENMAFGLRNQGATSAETDSRIREVSERLEIRDILLRLPGEISGGQQQRVALGRALVRRPDVYLFDEPLSDLDADLRTKLRTEIKRLHRDLGQTMVYVTHDQTEAMTLADRVVVLKNGQVQQVACPEDLYNQPETRFVATFVGNPSMNVIAGQLLPSPDGTDFVGGGIRLPLGKMAANVPANVTLGIRPEHLRLDADLVRQEKSTLSATIELVEFAGECTYLHLIVGSTRLIAYHRNPSQSTAREPAPTIENGSTVFDRNSTGKTIQVGMDTNAVHLFDGTSGRRLANS